jgi:UDP-GlcNAc3NAcA epimerase
MKIISVAGARPQFIKLAPLSKSLSQEHEEIIVHTGQHYDDAMSENFFRELGIKKPKYNLSVGSGSHGVQTGNMLIKLDEILINEQPDAVVVFGDTNSTLAGALSAVKFHIPVIHIEAGLRSYNRTMPEEINRIATDHVSDYLFAPTQIAMNILEKEGLKERSYLTGDIMVDTISSNLELALRKSDIMNKLAVIKGNFYLVTLHRPYNVDEPESLQAILNMLGKLDKKVVFPIHPRTRKNIQTYNIALNSNIILTEPAGYFDFICLEFNSDKILTDSGGIQKEAYILKRPCITFRPETEWIETIEDGWNVLLDPKSEDCIEKIISFKPKSEQSDVFGNQVASKMLEIINKLSV